MTTKITKAKIVDGLFLNVEYSQELDGHGQKTAADNLTVPVHKDLQDAFKKLVGHLAAIADEIHVKKLTDGVLDKYTCSGYSIKGDKETEGIVLTGGKKTKYGHVVLNTPFQRISTSAYGSIDELALLIETCNVEVKAYLFDGKRAPDQQMNLFAGGENNSDDLPPQIDELGKKATKKNREKKAAETTEPGAGVVPEKPQGEKPKRVRGDKKNKEF